MWPLSARVINLPLACAVICGVFPACGGAPAPIRESSSTSIKITPLQAPRVRPAATDERAESVAQGAASSEAEGSGTGGGSGATALTGASEVGATGSTLGTLQGARVLAKQSHPLYYGRVYGTEFYWVHGNGHDSLRSTGSSISKISIEGGSVVRVTPPAQDTSSHGQLRLTTAGMFYTVDVADSRGDDRIAMMPLAGGAGKTLIKADDPMLAVSDTHLYWSTNAFEAETKEPTKIERMPLSGGPTERLLTLPEGVIRALAYANEQLYFTLNSGNYTKRTIHKMPLTGGASQKLADVPNDLLLDTMRLNGKHIYLRTQNRELVVYPTVGGASKSITGVGAACKGRIGDDFAVNDSHLYWVESGVLKRCSLVDGKAEVLFSGPKPTGEVGSRPTGILALDGGRLFFTSSSPDRSEHYLLRRELGSAGP